MGQLGIQYLKFYKEHTNYFKLLNYMGDHKSMKNDGDAEVGKLLIQKNKEVWNLNVELFQEGINQGIFKNDFDPFEFAITLWAASNGIIMLLDHMKSQTQGASETELKEYPFCSINFEEILNRLWERLISSILADQSSEVKERYFKAEARS
jgi:hypothetical protein